MDWMTGRETVQSFLKKYKYAAIALLFGIFLLMFPQTEPDKNPQPVIKQENNLQTSLEEILERIHGAGNVSVLLTQKSGEETIYQTDENSNGEDRREQTILISGLSREETGLVRQVKSPIYLGAVIVCEGAERAEVKLAIVDAVRSATGLTADRICVLKMK